MFRAEPLAAQDDWQLRLEGGDDVHLRGRAGRLRREGRAAAAGVRGDVST
jgi:hypothetical protein